VTAPVLRLVTPPPKQARDTLALERVAAGDLGGLAELYDRHAPALLRFAARAAGPNDAEDLLQATFVRVVRIAPSYDGRASTARPWLYGVMARLIAERRRSLARFARALLRLPEPVLRLDSACDGLEGDVSRALDQLPYGKRVVLVLAEVEGYTCEEIARMLGIPVGTVWTRLHHARRLLRAFFDEEGSR